MKVLVTGGTGFTGKALCRRLLEQGQEVIALDYKEGLRTEELRGWGAEVVIGSVTDRQAVRRCMVGVDLVHHLAAAFRETNVPDSFYREVNVEGTRTVLAEAAEAGVAKVVYCSTCGVHGDVENPPAAESAPIKPADYYQRTKYEGEIVAREFSTKGLKTVIIRPAAIYGPGDPERFLLIYRRVAKGRFPMFGSGRTLYHPLYIDNLVDAFMAVMAPGVGDDNAYLIADEQYFEIRELVRLVAESMDVPLKIDRYPLWPVLVAGHVFEKTFRPFGLRPPIFPRRVDWYRQNRAFSIEKAKREIGYQPKVGIREGLRRTADWYRQEGYL